MVDSCRWSSACLCVLWSYNKRWSNGIIISYMYPLYTLPHGTPTWDNFRGAETRNNMNPVCHCTGQCNVKDVGTWSAGEVINPWKRRRACFGIENTNVSDCMMFPQFVPEKTANTEEEYFAVSNVSATVQFAQYCDGEMSSKWLTLHHPNEQSKSDPEENTLRQMPKCVMSSVVDVE